MGEFLATFGSVTDSEIISDFKIIVKHIEPKIEPKLNYIFYIYPIKYRLFRHINRIPTPPP